MINYETLLSTYDDKLTLMQWLKKVETALKDASAVSFNVNKRGDATLTFSVVFEDGSELESDPIVLQQGESVESAAIVNGHLILTLSNGDTLDAGNTGAVSGFSIDASQHLIVTYQNGTTQDLGAIFSGNVNIVGTLTTSGAVNASLVNANALTSNNDEIVAQKPVVEDMIGYSFTPGVNQKCTEEHIYVGVVKNGNKLTFVVFEKIVLDADNSNDYFNLGTFVIPAAVASKIHSTTIGGINFVDNRTLTFVSGLSNFVDTYGYMQGEGASFNMSCFGIQGLSKSTEYFVRYEATFLLSDSLAA